jgi:hypothetical protein
VGDFREGGGTSARFIKRHHPDARGPMTLEAIGELLRGLGFVEVEPVRRWAVATGTKPLVGS